MAFKKTLSNFDPNEFKLTKGAGVAVDNAKENEPILWRCLYTWLDSVIRLRKIDKTENNWQRYYPLYGEMYLDKVVMDSMYWPKDIPIGYVFLSWVLSTQTKIYKLDEHKDAFESWMNANDNKRRIFIAYKKGRLHLDDPASTDGLFKDYDVETDIIYGG